MKTENKPTTASLSKNIPHSSYTTLKLCHLTFTLLLQTSVLLPSMGCTTAVQQPFLPQLPWDATSNHPPNNPQIKVHYDSKAIVSTASSHTHLLLEGTKGIPWLPGLPAFPSKL